MELKPFFCYFGGKWQIAPKYPFPRSRTIIEPFAGAAGYSTRHYEKDVILYEKNPIIAGLWKYLIYVSPSEIRKLPLEITDLRRMDLPQGAKYLIGFWLNKGTSSPRNIPGQRMRAGLRPKSHWSETVRERIAYQVTKIRHWTVHESSHLHAPDIRATWFIDPPYKGVGAYHYKYHVKDYRRLSEWCRSRRGQVMVCEGVGADWMPFKEFLLDVRSSNVRGRNRWRTEMLWTNEGNSNGDSKEKITINKSVERV